MCQTTEYQANTCFMTSHAVVAALAGLAVCQAGASYMLKSAYLLLPLSLLKDAPWDSIFRTYLP